MESYVEKMANKIRAHIFEGINENIPDIINQIIADTKAACEKAIKEQLDVNFGRVIAGAEVKEQKK